MKSTLALLAPLVLVGLGACSTTQTAAPAPGCAFPPTPSGAGKTTTTMMGLGHLPDSLSAEQRAQVDEIALDLRDRQRALMRQMHAYAAPQPGGASVQDEQAARRELEGLHREMLEKTIAARRRIEALLTPEQRLEWRRAGTPAR